MSGLVLMAGACLIAGTSLVAIPVDIATWLRFFSAGVLVGTAKLLIALRQWTRLR